MVCRVPETIANKGKIVNDFSKDGINARDRKNNKPAPLARDGFISFNHKWFK
jgi:hypothetical protein